MVSSVTMGNTQSGQKKWGKTDLALIAAAAAIVPAWTHWLNETHAVTHKEDHVEAQHPVGGNGSTTEVAKTDAAPEWTLYKPTSVRNLVQGFGPTFAYLAVLDALIARKAVDQTSRFFILHTLANIAITISCTPDAARALLAPLDEPCGKMSILPVYIVVGLFAYHVTPIASACLYCCGALCLSCDTHCLCLSILLWGSLLIMCHSLPRPQSLPAAHIMCRCLRPHTTLFAAPTRSY